MRTWLRTPRHPLFSLLVGLATLAACESTTEPPSVARVGATLTAQSRGVEPVMVPIVIRETARPAPDANLEVCTPETPEAPTVALATRLIGTGQGSHLGKVTTVVLRGPCSVDAQGIVTMSGTSIRTAANGDQLIGNYTSSSTADGFTTNITFVGGTGRFANTFGTGTARGTEDPITGTSQLVVTGVISRPGA